MLAETGVGCKNKQPQSWLCGIKRPVALGRGHTANGALYTDFATFDHCAIFASGRQGRAGASVRGGGSARRSPRPPRADSSWSPALGLGPTGSRARHGASQAKAHANRRDKQGTYPPFL